MGLMVVTTEERITEQEDKSEKVIQNSAERNKEKKTHTKKFLRCSNAWKRTQNHTGEYTQKQIIVKYVFQLG